MKIGIDATDFSSIEATGREWYAHFLLLHLIPLLGRNHHDEVRLLVGQKINIESEFPFNVRQKQLSFRRFSLPFRTNWELFFHPVDLYFSPIGRLPHFLAKKNIVSVMGLDVEHGEIFSGKKSFFKKIADFFRKRRARKNMKRIVQKAYRIIVPSESVKKDLMEIYRCHEEKLVVIPPGSPEVSPLLHWSNEEIMEKRKQFFLEEKDLFMLFVGTMETKKNLIRLLQAFKRFLVEFPDWKLVLAGKRGEGFEEIWSKVLELQLERNVIAPGYVTEEEKNFLYSNCRFVVYPSLYQGFGMPILEAFAFRRPALTSKIFGTGEVANDAAFLVNPEKVEEMSIGLKRLASDGILASRFIQKGSQRLEQFSWDRCALRTYEVITE